ncbi:MAG: phosphoribosylglycinamide formyltransferase [Rickettsiales bacterium]|nr:phosphoribosylglycinamide formyltransferase [Rickettsiales bacterium]
MAKKRVVVLISGNGSNLQSLIDACAAPEFPAQIVQVISNSDQAFGLNRAQKVGIDTLVIDHTSFSNREEFDAALHEALLAADADIVCLAGFMRVLTDSFVRLWNGKMLNIHPSLLPAYKGLHTHRRAIEDGVKFAGCTIHYVVPELDSGPIIVQAVVPVLPGDTEQSLAARVLEQEHKIYPKALEWLANGSLALKNNKAELSVEESPASCLISPKLDVA